MASLSTAFSKSIGQLSDRAILKVLLKTILITLAIFALLGGVLWFGLDHLLGEQGFAFSAELGAIVALLVAFAGGWLLFRIVALGVLQFFADEIVQAVEAKHYPELIGAARKLPFPEELANSARGAGRALLANGIAAILAIPLLFTAIGPAIVFWAVNAWLLGRELQDMVWLRHRGSPADPPPLSGPTRFLLGGAVAALLVVPFLNLLAPIIGAASATHLVHGRRGSHNAA